MFKNTQIRNVPELGYIQYINLKTSVFNNKALLESQIIEIRAISLAAYNLDNLSHIYKLIQINKLTLLNKKCKINKSSHQLARSYLKNSWIIAIEISSIEKAA